jgi:hydroxyacid-oxoacid transhydrogenase
MPLETVITVSSSNIKFGAGATREVGFDMARLGAKRVMVVTDPRIAQLETVAVVMASLHARGLDAALFDHVAIEPTAASFGEAIRFARQGAFDGFIGVGGGSSIDTAKAADLYSTYPADLLAYVNAPVGEGKPVPGPLKPLIGIPTTAGTGSETTGTAIFDHRELHAKTGISSVRLRPVLGIIDPDNTRTLPRMVAISTGWDVLTHAIESITAIAYNQRPAADDPTARPAYQGANPISDVWAARAVEMVAKNIVRVADGDADDDVRSQMLLAATMAGIGFGNAGVHLPHAMSYPVAGGVRAYAPPDYPSDHPMIPHGIAVTLNAPAAFRWCASADPARHLWAAQLLGADVSRARPNDAGAILARTVGDLMRRTGMPNGLGAVGFTPADVDQLVTGTLAQQRLLKLSPRTVDAAALQSMFVDAMTIW